jgi:hypothetical protein
LKITDAVPPGARSATWRMASMSPVFSIRAGTVRLGCKKGSLEKSEGQGYGAIVG